MPCIGQLYYVTQSKHSYNKFHIWALAYMWNFNKFLNPLKFSWCWLTFSECFFFAMFKVFQNIFEVAQCPVVSPWCSLTSFWRHPKRKSWCLQRFSNATWHPCHLSNVAWCPSTSPQHSSISLFSPIVCLAFPSSLGKQK